MLYPSVAGDAEGGDREDERKAVMLQGLPEQCSQSSLWDRSVRDNVTDNKLSEQVLPPTVGLRSLLGRLRKPAMQIMLKAVRKLICI